LCVDGEHSHTRTCLDDNYTEKTGQNSYLSELQLIYLDHGKKIDTTENYIDRLREGLSKILDIFDDNASLHLIFLPRYDLYQICNVLISSIF